MEYLKDANERQTRQFAAIVAERIGIHGVAIVCYAFGVSRNTVYRGLHELQAKEHLDEGKVRKKGGGRKSTLSVHPEYINIFREIVEFDIAGLPQDANTKWLRLTPSQIQMQKASSSFATGAGRIPPGAGSSSGVSLKPRRDWASTSGSPTIHHTAPNGTLLNTGSSLRFPECGEERCSTPSKRPGRWHPGRGQKLASPYSRLSTEEHMRQRKNETHFLKASVTSISSRTKSCQNGTTLSNATEDINNTNLFFNDYLMTVSKPSLVSVARSKTSTTGLPTAVLATVVLSVSTEESLWVVALPGRCFMQN